ncbi:hypothetical protein E6H31_02975 [Candidatus Bathyarchaeota archaeon]|nr:MAG: hypothetical protein E6H31_02975 [Candidatus Bathyarchaeota archaeon]
MVTLLLGVNLSAGVFLYVLLDGTGPLSLLEILFWGGQIMNVVGFGIILVARSLRRTRSGDKAR